MPLINCSRILACRPCSARTRIAMRWVAIDRPAMRPLAPVMRTFGRSMYASASLGHPSM